MSSSSESKSPSQDGNGSVRFVARRLRKGLSVLTKPLRRTLKTSPFGLELERGGLQIVRAINGYRTLLTHKDRLFPSEGLNAVLRNQGEVEQAKRMLAELNVPLHNDDPKNWDCYRALSFILRKGNLASRVLDVGAPKYSIILPALERFGLRRLEACDLCYDEDEFRIGQIRYMKQDLTSTTYRDGSFDFITSISVVEHGVNLDRYFKEMSRLLQGGGYLFTSTDYWPDPIDCTGLYPYGPDMGEMKIFDRPGIDKMVDTAAKYDLVLTEPIDYRYQDRVVHWKRVDRKYTFIFLVMRKHLR